MIRTVTRAFLALLLVSLAAHAFSGPVVYDSQFTRGRRISITTLRKPCTYVSTGDVVVSVDWTIKSGSTVVLEAAVPDFTAPYCINDNADLDVRMLADGNYTLEVAIDNATIADSTYVIPFTVALENRTDLANVFVNAAFAGTEAGTKSAPYRTIQAAVNAAASGQTILVRPGIYREAVTIPTNKSGLTLIGQASSSARASIRGSDAFTGAGAWNLVSGNQLRTASTFPESGTSGSQFALATSQCRSESNGRCRYRDQVFWNGIEVFQEVDGTANGIPDREQAWPGDTTAYYGGDFYYDGATDTYVATIAVGATVQTEAQVEAGLTEITRRTSWITAADATADNTTIRGFDFRHAANNLQASAIFDNDSDNWLIEWNTTDLSHSHAVKNNGLGGVLRNNRFLRSGHMVLGGDQNSGKLIRNEIAYGNREEVSSAWEAGGVKWARSSGPVEWRENSVHHNDGVGLWCDIDCNTSASAELDIIGNRLDHNSRQGISVEISGTSSPGNPEPGTINCRITGNKAWENGHYYQGFWMPYLDAGAGTSYRARDPNWLWGAGIMIHNSSNCAVTSNTLAWNGDGITFVQQVRSRFNQWPDLLGGSTTDDASTTNDNPALPGGSGNDSTTDRTRMWGNYASGNRIALSTYTANNNYVIAWHGDVGTTYDATNDGRVQWQDGNGNQSLFNNRGEGNIVYVDQAGGGGTPLYRFATPDLTTLTDFNNTFGGDNGSGTATTSVTLSAFQTDYLVPNGMPVAPQAAGGF